MLLCHLYTSWVYRLFFSPECVSIFRHIVISHLIFWGTARLFSIVATLLYICTNLIFYWFRRNERPLLVCLLEDQAGRVASRGNLLLTISELLILIEHLLNSEHKSAEVSLNAFLLGRINEWTLAKHLLSVSYWFMSFSWQPPGPNKER